VGVSISKVKSILGDPDEIKDNVYSYISGEGMAGVDFHTQKGVVKEVEWTAIPD